MKDCFEIEKVRHCVEERKGFGDTVEDIRRGLAQVNVGVGEFAVVGFEIKGRGKS